MRKIHALPWQLLQQAIALLIVLSVLVFAIGPSGKLPAAPVRAAAERAADGWVTLVSQDFEGDFPSAGWHIGREGGIYLWGKSACYAHSGSYSIGSHTGGSLGSQLTCQDEYPLNYVTTLSYGPMDLTTCTDLRLNFSHLTHLDSIDDALSVGYSNDGGASWSVLTYGGDRTLQCEGWCTWTLYAASYPIPLCGKPKVYLLFRFQSDFTDPGFGSWVDDVSLEAYYGTPVGNKKVYLPLATR